MLDNYISSENNKPISLKDIPELPYNEFLETNVELLNNNSERHCVNYFGLHQNGHIRLFCCIADDITNKINVTSAIVTLGTGLPSMAAHNHNFVNYEREISENFGFQFNGHPWDKPLRYPFNRADNSRNIDNHPFFRGEHDELHEVGVGPIHAGVIEPGHFRFICNGEQIMHLEIQLGFQHRGVEHLFLKKKKLSERITLAENIAGDTTVSHTTAFANLWEGLCGYEPNRHMEFTRTLASELERIAIHTGDLAAICADIAYQLGNSVYGRLRTPIVNFFQEWGGNRLAKGLIRAGKVNYPFTEELAGKLDAVFSAYLPDFEEMTNKFTKLPSALSRLEKTGVVSYNQVLEIGTVGMAARMSGLVRDIRKSHPYNLYKDIIHHEPVIKHHGDVYSRVQLRKEEIKQSIGYARELLKSIPSSDFNTYEHSPMPDTFIVSLTEGWRGEICHCAITGSHGELALYKIKDPSFHNWMALAQAVRNNEISDFPINNKSFNLSYCGFDL
ncbi:MAG TPA: hypothetical protein VK172_09555 [Lentimicrobium sp.]|nr:hypothetical protein [Lentimicrobium sp.]